MEYWKKEYEQKLCTAEEAIKLIKSGDHLLVGGNRSRPEHIIKTLIEHASDYRNVTIKHGLSAGNEFYANEEYSENFNYESLFIPSGIPRKAINEGHATNIPIGYADIGPSIIADRIHADVFTFQVCPPDRYGFCSCGLNADFLPEAIQAAGRIILQINNNMPRSFGPDCTVHISQADAIVEYNEPIPFSKRPDITSVEKKIGEYCASLINDGSTIQVGIGAIPNAVCKSLLKKKNLRVHSEMIEDGIMELCKAGAITREKSIDEKSPVVTAFVLGSQEMYDYINDNPIFYEARTAYVNNPFVIAKCHDFISINSCVEIDISGQVVAGSAGLRRISGAGGQLDFVKGANLTLDGKGKSILAMTSTHTKNGVAHSRIKPFLTKGSSVTVPAQDTDYFVTEYGIAHVKGRNRRDTAKALIKIAHPDFRPELINEYERRFKTAYND